MADGSPPPSGALIPNLSIEELVAAKGRAEALFRQAWTVMQAGYDAAQIAAPATNVNTALLVIGGRR
jgi:hypothetical protein